MVGWLTATAAAALAGLLYAGRLSGTGSGDPPVLALACSTTYGKTVFEVDTANAGVGGISRVKFTDPHAVMVMPALEDPSTGDDRALVLARPPPRCCRC